MGWAVHEREGNDLAAELLMDVCHELGVDPGGVSLHSDNGSAMKGATMLATMQGLGIMPSFSRPGVCDDNPFIEALFRTMKYRPTYPEQPFADAPNARQWVGGFVHWHNHEHLHSAIGFVTPHDRHTGRDIDILAKRRELYARACAVHPERWTGMPRKWKRPAIVRLNPERTVRLPRKEGAQAA